MINQEDRPELEQSEVVEALPLACSNELAAVEFIEEQRWGKEPKCPHCEATNVYKMTDRDGTRNKRFLWRCRSCGEQYTVRIGTVYEESRLPLRHWCYAFWRASTSKKGVAALEISRQCQITYKSALFLMHRIRWAMAPTAEEPKEKLGADSGIVECDEVYIGGKPRPGSGKIYKRGKGTKKTPVFAIVERGGNIRRQVIADVTGKTLKQVIRENVVPEARIMTDEAGHYRGLHKDFKSYETVLHCVKEYVRGDVTTNTAESSFAVLKRGITGIYHAVSKKHLHRYISEFARKMNDGERTAAAIRKATGKRLMYREPVATVVKNTGDSQTDVQ